MPVSLPTAPALVGLLDRISAFKVEGWAFDKHQPDLAVELALCLDGAVVKRFRPHVFWHTLASRLGLDGDKLAPVRFVIDLPPGAADGQPHSVEVRCAYTGKALPSEQSGQVQFINPHLPVAHLPSGWLPPTVVSKRKEMGQPQVTVVVLNRNGAEVLSALLSSWVQHNRTVLAEWVVIDHASTDHSLQVLEHWASRIPLRVKALEVNQSFSASCNLGASLARTPNLLFLNNDLIWQHDALPEMLVTLNRPDVCAVGLKLLRTVSGFGGEVATEVQHLGVRFLLNGDGYAPYELTPEGKECEFAPQAVPAVTGAALLCRAADYWAAGGFDEAYFYGFEDVEFCMRLRARTAMSIVCRNDLVALHRHGYTRLTGREQSVLRRLWHNSNVLDRHLGLWLKCHWWHDLVNGTGHLTTEVLTIGCMVPELPPPYGMADALPPILADMGRLIARLKQGWPAANVVLVHPGRDLLWARGLHVLVVTDPSSRRSVLKEARPDLRCVAWVSSHPEQWVNSPDWLEWDAHLAASSSVFHALKRQTVVAVEKDWASHLPLGRRMLPLLAEPVSTWRAMVCWPSGSQQWTHEAHANAQVLRSAWASLGVPCHLRGAVRVTQPDMADAVSAHAQPWVAEVCVWVLPTNFRRRRLPLPRLDGACLNVVWWCDAPVPEQPVDWPADESHHVVQPDVEVATCPSVTEVQRSLEDRIGRTFSAP